MFSSIMVPLDGSAFAEQALSYALAVARRAGAALHLMRVHVVYALQPPASSWLPYDAALESESRRRELDYLTAVAGRLAPQAAVRVLTGLADGLAADGILAHARAVSADLIVMTTHGAGPLSRVFLGSTADELVRRSPTPLLLIRPHEKAAGLGTEPVVRRILIPLDGSTHSEQILGPALALGRLTGAAFKLLHVVERPRDVSHKEEEGRPYLEGLAERLRQQSVKVETRVVTNGHVASAVLTEVVDSAYDLIALATHGRGGFKRFLLGSVADKVLRAAPCPLLVLRPDGKDPADQEGPTPNG